MVSVVETAGRDPVRYDPGETSESEPSMNCRKRMVDVRTGGGGHPGMSMGGALKSGPCGIRLEGGVNLDQALLAEQENLSSRCQGRRPIGKPPKGPEYRCGAQGQNNS